MPTVTDSSSRTRTRSAWGIGLGSIATGKTTGTSWTTTRQRILEPSDIAGLAPGTGLWFKQGAWGVCQLHWATGPATDTHPVLARIVAGGQLDPAPRELDFDALWGD